MAKIMFEFTICSDNWEPNGIIKFLGIEKENFHFFILKRRKKKMTN